MPKKQGRRLAVKFYDVGPIKDENNNAVTSLARLGIPQERVRSIMLSPREQRLGRNYESYRAFLTGASPDEALPSTGKSIQNEQGETVLVCWQIVILWKENQCLQALWSAERNDFLVSWAIFPLRLLSRELIKHLNGAADVLFWVEEMLGTRTRGDEYSPQVARTVCLKAAERMAKNRIKPNKSVMAKYTQSDRKTVDKWYKRDPTLEQDTFAAYENAVDQMGKKGE